MKKIKLIDKKEVAIITLDKNTKTFVIYISILLILLII